MPPLFSALPAIACLSMALCTQPGQAQSRKKPQPLKAGRVQASEQFFLEGIPAHAEGFPPEEKPLGDETRNQELRILIPCETLADVKDVPLAAIQAATAKLGMSAYDWDKLPSEVQFRFPIWAFHPNQIRYKCVEAESLKKLDGMLTLFHSRNQGLLGGDLRQIALGLKVYEAEWKNGVATFWYNVDFYPVGDFKYGGQPAKPDYDARALENAFSDALREELSKRPDALYFSNKKEYWDYRHGNQRIARGKALIPGRTPGGGAEIGSVPGPAASSSSPRGEESLVEARWLAEAGVFATIHRPYEIKTWKPGDGKAGQTLSVPEGARISGMAPSPDGRFLATSGGDGVRVWDLQSGKLQRILPPDNCAYYESVCFSPDGALLAGGGSDGKIRLWDPKSGQLLRGLPEKVGAKFFWSGGAESGRWFYIKRLVFTSDGKALIAFHGNGESQVWDCQSFSKAKSFDAPSTHTIAAAFSRDSNQLFVASAEGTLSFIDPGNWKVARSFNAVPGGGVLSAALMQGNRACLLVNGKKALVVDLGTGAVDKEIRMPGTKAEALVVSEAGAFVFNGTSWEKLAIDGM
jgi:hypothetical protein